MAREIKVNLPTREGGQAGIANLDSEAHSTQNGSHGLHAASHSRRPSYQPSSQLNAIAFFVYPRAYSHGSVVSVKVSLPIWFSNDLEWI